MYEAIGHQDQLEQIAEHEEADMGGFFGADDDEECKLPEAGANNQKK